MEEKVMDNKGMDKGRGKEKEKKVWKVEENKGKILWVIMEKGEVEIIWVVYIKEKVDKCNNNRWDIMKMEEKNKGKKG
jgi:hypothetical protein